MACPKCSQPTIDTRIEPAECWICGYTMINDRPDAIPWDVPIMPAHRFQWPRAIGSMTAPYTAEDWEYRKLNAQARATFEGYDA